MEIKIYYHDAGHMTKMAAIPIYGKNSLKNVQRNLVCSFINLDPVCPHYYPGLTFTCFSARSILQLRLLYRKDVIVMDSLEIITAFGLGSDE